MKKLIIEQLVARKVVCVVRTDSYQEALAVVDGCSKGGLKIIEITYSMPFAHKLIGQLAEESDLIIGAGSVLDSETARLAIVQGAKFIVSPTFDVQTAMLCNRYSVLYIPGCMTITESVKALEYGCDLIKIFPAAILGSDYIKALQGPLPNVSVMATGGINQDNFTMWLNQGAAVVGIGSEFTKLVKDKKISEIERLATMYVQTVGGE